ncbi:Re/Si-specific NAD(P)(+) transhydrogenase subunit alpha [soil metagenome]
MYVNVAVLKETRPHERRVAMVPSVAGKLNRLGARLHMQTGAAEPIRLGEPDYPDVVFVPDRTALVKDADVVLCVQPPALDVVEAMKPGAILISFVYAQKEPALIDRLIERRITCFAMERVPRISRAQAMDALSSQSALAGYYAVQLGATHLARVLPKITTAAGAIGPARVLVMGLGVAGLEAIATAHRLGAVVEGYDVRPETREQALSLGAKFVETGVNGAGKGGYARALTPDEQATVAEALTQHIQQADLVITTAAIPGRPSPRLISKAQVVGMKAGAVIVDLSAEGGGNCEAAVPGETIRIGGVTLVAPLNVPSMLAEDASDLYARNLFNLLALMLKDNVVTLDWDDAILAGTVLTHDGERKDTPPGPPETPAKAARPALARLS